MLKTKIQVKHRNMVLCVSLCKTAKLQQEWQTKIFFKKNYETIKGSG